MGPSSALGVGQKPTRLRWKSRYPAVSRRTRSKIRSATEFSPNHGQPHAFDSPPINATTVYQKVTAQHHPFSAEGLREFVELAVTVFVWLVTRLDTAGAILDNATEVYHAKQPFLDGRWVCAVAQSVDGVDVRG